MAHIPAKVACSELVDTITTKEFFKPVNEGKVRQLYWRSPSAFTMLMVATNRLSIFDFVLPTLVPCKGEVLTALTVFWLTEVLESIPHHLQGYGAGINTYLPQVLADDTNLEKCALVVKRAKISPVECVIRGYLTGSGWRSYRDDNGQLCGHSLPAGLHDGSRLPIPLFTPDTKAEVGHDEHISVSDIRRDYGWQPEGLSLAAYSQATEYALSKGIILADTKFELGEGVFGNINELMLCDEVLTPDSSRFWDVDEWQEAVKQGKSPSGYDKEPVRQWGLTVETPFGVTGLNKLDTTNPDHLAFVDSLDVPEQVVFDTSDRYLAIFKRLTGSTLQDFQREKMAIRV